MVFQGTVCDGVAEGQEQHVIDAQRVARFLGRREVVARKGSFAVA